MGLAKVKTGIMTRKGQGSRWDYREFVKRAARKRRRREDAEESGKGE